MIFVLSLFIVILIVYRILLYFALTQCDNWCAYSGSQTAGCYQELDPDGVVSLSFCLN